MVSLTFIQSLLCILLSFSITNGFIPHPLLAYGALSINSITHAEITELGFIRSLARFFYDTRFHSNSTNGSRINEENYFATEHTIDELYVLAHPDDTTFEVTLHSLPLKFILDSIMAENVLVDFDDKTKLLAYTHFDNELFVKSNRRILQIRETIINHIRDVRKDLTNARELLGQLLHTLQDFYSHSNWVEMGKTDINELIGFTENIGTIAKQDQSTCTSNGCTRIEKSCTFWQQITLGICPLVYYDCQNNILPEINDQQILTSGYTGTNLGENNQVLTKPTNVEKCSHGSILDTSSHVPAIGGINKDSYSLIFSPHSNLHKNAVDLAIKATERFFNDLRRDIGDENFSRLFAIHPTTFQRQLASDSISQGKRFRFFSPHLASASKDDGRILTKVKNFFRRLYRLIKWIFIGTIFSDKNIHQPTYDVSDKGVNVKDVNSFRDASYAIGKEELRRKKRMIRQALARRSI